MQKVVYNTATGQTITTDMTAEEIAVLAAIPRLVAPDSAQAAPLNQETIQAGAGNV